MSDSIPELASLPEGFSFHSHHRTGWIYYREGERVMRFFCEVSGVDEYDMLLWLDSATMWLRPEGQSIVPSEKSRVVDALEIWVTAKGIRTDALGPIKRPLFARPEKM